MFTLWGQTVFGESEHSSQGSVDPEFAELQDILEHKRIESVFQPIVSLTNGSVLGYEALSRGPANSILHRPDKLFQAAAKYQLVWELEYLCRLKALEKVKSIIADKMIFINVDPKIFYDNRFQKGHTRELIEQFGGNINNVTFEITEKTAIEDYHTFRKALENYKSQGYHIAVDDTGAGYSGLKLLAESYAHFIKVDMDLIRNIDKDHVKQSMLKALHEFALMTNAQIIAEGIETAAELSTLIGLGIPFGQGFFLQKPTPEFTTIPEDISDYICKRHEQRKRQHFQTTLTVPIGELAQEDRSFLPATRGGKLLDYFNNNPNVLGVPVVDNGKPVGLIMKSKFFSRLATQYGVAVYMNRPVALLMDKHPLVVDYHTPLEQVAKSALAREDDSVYDYILITRDGHYYGMTSIKRLLEATTQIEINRAKHANPLTGLPGNVMVERELERVVHDEKAFAVLYFDLDNFKAYNDAYGFEQGDRALGLTAQVIQTVLYEQYGTDCFLGHIGGDDFVAIVYHAEVSQLCESLIERFDSRIQSLYNEADRKQGHIVARNRHGAEEVFPLMSISIAVVVSKQQCFCTPSDIAEKAAAIKKKCKMVWHSCYLTECCPA